MFKIGSKLIGFLLSKSARLIAGTVGVITNSAVRKMILGQASKRVALSLASAYGVYEAAAYVYDEVIEGKDGTLRLADGTPPPSTTKEEIELALREAGYDPEVKLTEQNFPGLVKAIKAKSKLPRDRIEKLEAAMYRELAADKEESAAEPSVSEYLEDEYGDAPTSRPSASAGSVGGVLAVARALNGVAKYSGRPPREVAKFLQHLETLRATSPADIDAAVELMKESSRVEFF